MLERRLDFERLDAREMCAIVGVGAEGDQVTDGRRVVPVTIDDSTGVRAAEVRMRYDADTWSVEPSSITTGNAWVRGGATLAKVDPEAGEITVFVFATEELAGAQGNLLNVELSPQKPESTSIAAIAIDSVRLNEGAIKANVEDDVDAPWGNDGDYINPRIRALHGLQVPLQLPESHSDEPSPIAESAAADQDISDGNDEGLSLQQSRNRNLIQGMGPIQLRKFSSTVITSRESAVARIVVDEPKSEQNDDAWLLMLTDEESRLRKRAA